MPKPGKLQKILANTKIADDITLEVGGESFTVGELRELHNDTEGGSTAELEAREANLIKAQQGLAETLQRVAERTGVPLEKLLANDLEGITPPRVEVTPGDDDDPLSELDPKVLKALEKKFGKDAVAGEVASMKKELQDTKKALAIALKVNMDDYYQTNWDRLKSEIPEGVDLDLTKALKYADENNIREKGTGRYNLRKAVTDLTADARLKSEIEKARLEGEKLGREKALVEAMPRPGQQRSQHLKPPVDEKGRTHSIEHQLNEAMNDNEITKMLTGPFAEA
jgi:hypothetical protein